MASLITILFGVLCAIFDARPLVIVYCILAVVDFIIKAAMMLYFGVYYALTPDTSTGLRAGFIVVLCVAGFAVAVRIVLFVFSLCYCRPAKSNLQRLSDSL